MTLFSVSERKKVLREQNKEENRMILLYGGNKDTYVAIAKQFLKDRTIRHVNDSMLNYTIGQLIDPNSDLEFFASPTQMYDEMIIYFTEDEREQIIPLFHHFEQQGLAHPVAAIETPNNLKMTLKEELEDLLAEEQYFKKRNRLVEFLENVNSKRLEQDGQYREFVMLVFSLLQQEQLPEKVVDEMIQIMDDLNSNEQA